MPKCKLQSVKKLYKYKLILIFNSISFNHWPINAQQKTNINYKQIKGNTIKLYYKLQFIS